jgi:hypothetical protein
VPCHPQGKSQDQVTSVTKTKNNGSGKREYTGAMRHMSSLWGIEGFLKDAE